MSVFATKYFVLSPERLNQDLAKLLGIELTRENIWHCLLYQTGKYRGLKFGINSRQQALLVNDLIGLIIERHKVLKQDQTLINS